MSAKSATGSAAPSVEKWVIKKDVENQLRSGALKTRLLDESLSYGSIELFLRCPNLTAMGGAGSNPSACAYPSCESTSPVVPSLRVFRCMRSLAVAIS